MSMETQYQKEARMALRENIKRLARLREAGQVIAFREVWPERQLLFSLVHGYVCASSGYAPMGDMQLMWADWFLNYCEDPAKAQPYLHEEATLMLILQWEMERCGRDLACGE